MSYTLDFCACITTNMYFKIFVVTVLGLMITFVDEIDVLKEKHVLYAIVGLLILMTFTNLQEYGAILLLVMLVALSYNITLNSDLNENQRQLKLK